MLLIAAWYPKSFVHLPSINKDLHWHGVVAFLFTWMISSYIRCFVFVLVATAFYRYDVVVKCKMIIVQMR
jgi:hypothetical protein